VSRVIFIRVENGCVKIEKTDETATRNTHRNTPTPNVL
jgi:hypothetical protein